MGKSGRAERGDPYEDRRKRLSSIGDVVRDILGDRRMRKGVALGRLAGDWGEVVGAPLARVSLPRSLEEGVLAVAVETPAWAMQLSFLADRIREKANALLGHDDVREVRVMVAPEVRKALRRNASKRTAASSRAEGRGASE